MVPLDGIYLFLKFNVALSLGYSYKKYVLSSDICIRHWRIAFIKQVEPILFNPTKGKKYG